MKFIYIILIFSLLLSVFKLNQSVDEGKIKSKIKLEAIPGDFQATYYFDNLLKNHTLPEIKQMVNKSKYKDNNVLQFLVQEFQVNYGYTGSFRGPYHEQLFFDYKNEELSFEEFYHLYVTNYGDQDLESLVSLYSSRGKNKFSYYYLIKAMQLYFKKNNTKSYVKIDEYLSKVKTSSIAISRQLMSFYFHLYESSENKQYLKKSLVSFYTALEQVKEKNRFAQNYFSLRITHLDPKDRLQHIKKTRKIIGPSSNFNNILDYHEYNLSEDWSSAFKSIVEFAKNDSLGIFYYRKLNYWWLSRQSTQFLSKYKSFFCSVFVDAYNSYSVLDIKRNFYDASDFFNEDLASYLKLLIRVGQYDKLKDFISEVKNKEHQSILTCFTDIAYLDQHKMSKDDVKSYCLDTYLNIVAKKESSEFKFWFFENLFPFLSYLNEQGEVDPYYQTMRTYLNDGGWDYKENETWLSEWLKFRFDKRNQYSIGSTTKIALSWVGQSGVSDFDIYCMLMRLDLEKLEIDHEYATLAAKSKKSTDNSYQDIFCESFLVDSFVDNGKPYKSVKHYQDYFDEEPSFMRLYLWVSASSKINSRVDKQSFHKNVSKFDFDNLSESDWKNNSFSLGAIGIQAIESGDLGTVEKIVKGFENVPIAFSSAKFLSRYYTVKRRDCKKSKKYSQILQDKFNYMKVRDGYLSEQHKADEFDLLRNAAMCNFNIEHKPGGVPF